MPARPLRARADGGGGGWFAPPLGGRVLVQELQREVEHLLVQLVTLEVAEALAKGRHRHHRLRHGPVPAGVADLPEALADELARVPRVSQVAHRHHE